MKPHARFVSFEVILLVIGSLVIPGVLNLPPASAQSSEQKDARSSWQKDDLPREYHQRDDLFDKLSGAARNALEKKYGKRKAGKELDKAPPPTREITPFSGYLNNTVNNPGADTSSQDTQSETTIVLGSGSNVVSAYNDSGSNTTGSHFTGYSTSGNSGVGWADRGTLPASGEGDAGDPSLGRSNATGRVFLATLGFNTFEQLQLFRSDDNGNSFFAPVNATPGFTGTGDFQDKEWLAVDNFSGPGQGNVYIAWRNFSFFGSGGIRFTRSTDGGQSWGPLQGVFIASEGAWNVQGAWVTVGPDHSVYVLWLDQSAGRGTPNIVKMRKSVDQGVSFGSAVTVATLVNANSNGDLQLSPGFRSNSFPQAAVNPANGSIYVTYNDRGAGGDKSDIYFLHSENGGATWSAPVRVNDDSTANDQWQPALTVTPDGARLFIGFYDRRRDPGNNLIDTFGALGTIAGLTVSFEPNFRITTGSFPAVFGQDPAINSTYMGDYDQSVADNSFFYYTWGDNRNSNAFHANQPDVRFARISTNPIDDSRYFVRQHYRDFLLREPDQGGWDFWTGQITQCGSDLGCVAAFRIGVSRAFFESGEFRQQPRAANLPNPNPPPQYNNREFVRMCYVVYLQREPDQGGWDFWTNGLDNCTNDPNRNGNNGYQCYQDIINAFLVSIEYRARFGRP